MSAPSLERTAQTNPFDAGLTSHDPDILASHPLDIDDRLAPYASQLQATLNRSRRLGMDGLEAGSSSRNYAAAMVVTTIMDVAALVAFDATVGSRSDVLCAYLGSAVGMLGTARYNVHRLDKHYTKRTTTLPDGYALQPVTANYALPDGEITVGQTTLIVLPRSGGQKSDNSILMARNRLKDALDVGLATNVDSITIPEVILEQAHMPGDSSQTSLRTLTEAITGLKLCIPHDEATCTILDRHAAGILAERLIDHKGDWSTVLKALQERYPVDTDLRQKMTDPGAMVSRLTTRYGLPAVSEYLMHAGRRVVRGTFTKVRVDLVTRIDPGEDPYDPIITQHPVGSYEPDNTHLSKLIGIQTPSAKALNRILTKIKAGNGFTDGELLYAALQVLKDFKLEEQVQQEQSLPQHDGSTKPNVISLQKKRNERSKRHLPLHVAKLALIGTLVGSVAGYLSDGYSVTHQTPVFSSIEGLTSPLGDEASVGWDDIQEDLPVWSVVGHDVNTDGYYPVSAMNFFDPLDASWYDIPSSNKTVRPPDQLADLNTPHITVSKWIMAETQDPLSLPVKVGTSIGSLMATDHTGKEVPYTLHLRNNGTYWLSFGETQPVFISYNLIPSDEPLVHADQPLAIGSTLGYPGSLPAALVQAGQAGPEALATYEIQRFKYLNGVGLNALVDNVNPNYIVDHVFDAGECNCSVCATVLDVVMSELEPHEDLVFTDGYRHESKSPYLMTGEQHAWSTNQFDTPIDGTPAGVLSLGKTFTPSQLKTIWAEETPENNSWPKPSLPIAAIGTLALLAGLRWYGFDKAILNSKLIQNGRRRYATQYFPAAASYHLLNWYGQAGQARTIPPAMTEHTAHLVRKWGNIDTDVLHRVASKETSFPFLTRRQMRSVRRTSQLVLRGIDI